MEPKYSWPPTESEFPSWMTNFTAFADTHATVIGFTETDVRWLKEVSAAATYTEKVATLYRKQWTEFVDLRNILYRGDPDNVGLPKVVWPPAPVLPTPIPAEVAPNVKPMLAVCVKKVSTCNDLTQEQKRTAGVLSRSQAKPRPDHVTPELTVKVVNGQAILDCPLRGCKGYAIYVTDDDGATVLLTNSTARKYRDTRPIPGTARTQQRTYFVQYLWNENEPVGNFSNAVTVAVMRMT